MTKRFQLYDPSAVQKKQKLPTSSYAAVVLKGLEVKPTKSLLFIPPKSSNDFKVNTIATLQKVSQAIIQSREKQKKIEMPKQIQMKQKQEQEEWIGLQAQWEQLEKWQAMRSTPIVVLKGPSGTGKTMMTYEFCKTFEYERLEMNSSIQNNGEDFKNFFRQFKNKHCVTSKTQTERKKVFVFEDVDGMLEMNYSIGYQFVSHLKEYLTLHQCELTSLPPIIFTCNHTYGNMLKPLFSSCTIIPFYKPKTSVMKEIFYSFVKKKNLEYNPYNVNNIIKDANGDVRQLQFLTELASLSPCFTIKEPGKNSLNIDAFTIVSLLLQNMPLSLQQEEILMEDRYCHSLLLQNYLRYPTVSVASQFQFIEALTLSVLSWSTQSIYLYRMMEAIKEFKLQFKEYDKSNVQSADDFSLQFLKGRSHSIPISWVDEEFSQVCVHSKK